MKANLVEIFESIQGEGRYAGAHQLFVRFAGCNVGCDYCDTNYTAGAYFTDGGMVRSNPIDVNTLADIILNRYNASLCHSVTFTGGEPLLHKDFLLSLSPILRAEGVKLFLETSGYNPENLPEIVPFFDYVSLDIKTVFTPFKDHTERLLTAVNKANHSGLYLKFVLRESEGELVYAAADMLQKHKISEIWLQPVDNLFNFKTIMQWQRVMKQKGVTAYFVPQIHKLLNIQ